MTQPAAQVAPARKLRVAFIGIGWWSDVLADAAMRSTGIEIASCYTRSDGKRAAFAAKYACRAAATYEEILGDRTIEAIVNTTCAPQIFEARRPRPSKKAYGIMIS